LSVFGLDKALAIARGVKALLSSRSGDGLGAAPDTARHEGQAESPKGDRRPRSEQRNRLKSKKRDVKLELSRVKEDLHAAKSTAGKSKAERSEQMKMARKKRQELLQLKSELQAMKEREAEGITDGSTASRVAEGLKTGKLPDFVIIGPGRSGTTFLYRLLSRHPFVEPAAKKELHFFDLLFEEGTEWYRRWFPAPRSKDGRWTITGEATPAYIFHPLVPERMAKVIPRVRLIALLRNPVDRTYSAYHHRVSKGRESRTFEEVIEADLYDASLELLSRSTYVDHLVRWSKFFSDEQLLVLKSENLFEHPQQTLKVVLRFLDLPDWEPEVWESGKQERYAEMDPSTRRLLEEYFEPHNKKLYDFLGRDFGW
jgi:Sulfotransferase domain